MILFSIIVPIYNVEKFLEQCIQSVLMQTFEDFELILVDDGSPDCCSEICDQYSKEDSRVKVIHKENGGIVSARQAGVKIATGEYIVCIDGDDWISPQYLQKMKEVIDAKDPDVICCGYYNAFVNTNVEVPLAERHGYYSRNDLEKEIFPSLVAGKGGKGFPPSLWAKAFKRTIYQQQQLVNVKVVMGEDTACVYPTIFHAQDMYVLQECLYYYRQNPTSVTKAKQAFPWDGPMLRGKHMENTIDQDFMNFREQTDWYVVYALSTVCSSQFHRNEKYSVIRREICKELNTPYYANILKRTKFRCNLRDTILLAAMKFRFTWIMWMYCKTKL